MEICSRVKKLLAFTHKGIACYHTVRFCGSIRRDFWFTFDTKAVFGEVKDDMTGQFDARSLPEKYKQGEKPIGWIGMAMSDDFDFKPITL